MKRRLLIIALGIGTVVGFGSGLKSLHHHRAARYDANMTYLSEVCVSAALRARGQQAAEPGAPPGHRWSGAQLDRFAHEVAARCADAAR